MTVEEEKPAVSSQAIVPLQPYYDRDGITIYNADCRQVLPFLDRFDLLLTDPPYGIGAANRRDGGAVCSRACGSKDFGAPSVWDSTTPPRWLLDAMQESAITAIVWGGNYYRLPPSMGWLVWDKGQRDFSLADAELAWTNRDVAVRVLTYSRGEAARDGRVHPTQKPLALMKWCLGLVPDAKSVLDPFMGSGTTLVAAKLLGLRAVGIEINADYCAKAVERLRQDVLDFGDN